jgi:transposase
MPQLTRKPYSGDVSDEEWALIAPYLTLLREDCGQRRHDLREVFNAMRWMVRAGAPWRLSPARFSPLGGGAPAGESAGLRPGSLRPWSMTCGPCCGWPVAVRLSPPRRCWMPAPCKAPVRAAHGPVTTGPNGAGAARSMQRLTPWATCWPCGSRPPTKTTGRKLANWSKPSRRLPAKASHWPTSTRGYTGEAPATAAPAHGVQLEVVKLPEAKRGFMLLPRRWVVERSFAWMARFRRLARDYERLPTTLAGLHFIAFACLLLARVTFLFHTC